MQNPFEHLEDRLNGLEQLLLTLHKAIDEMKTQSKSKDDVLSVSEAERIYNLSKSTFQKLMREGRLKYSKVGRRTVLRRGDIDECINTNAH
ncbi:helix-turn-helix domain-containing protein [Flammeovirga aprica]|uniref:Helix-turn-helix domain-containing protein n=1 Tax=Flammeovirga aprica JL-4 TaxID=694437 RepID=A0A7X9NZ58_9BACT|nr:helix-turn-helix domain-containing protein [Flammeovirga aprica]NME66606.1 helix-turn-helix domain-containing protein [Flammeovirga aprica JL-4]